MKIGIISPVAGGVGIDDAGDMVRLSARARRETELYFTYVKGRSSIECAYDDALAIPGSIEAARKFEKNGMDALVINCTADTGCDAIRECVNIPVVAPMMASMYFAVQMASSFSVITFMPKTKGRFKEMARRLGLYDRLSSVEQIKDPGNQVACEETVFGIVEACETAYKAHDAHAVILGCTALEIVTDKVRQELAKRNLPILILEPYTLALHTAEDMVEMQICHSKISYPRPDVFCD